jgi:hypothetical protein
MSPFHVCSELPSCLGNHVSGIDIAHLIKNDGYFRAEFGINDSMMTILNKSGKLSQAEAALIKPLSKALFEHDVCIRDFYQALGGSMPKALTIKPGSI